MTPPGPGRPRSFVPERALERIVDAFWRGGFAGTSYADLEAATGLGRQSLVYAFGDKQAMFVRALDHYAEARIRRLIERLEAAPTGLDAIARVLADWQDDAGRATRPGCLLVAVAGELGRTDPAACAVLDAAHARLAAALARSFARARATGEITAEASPEALAELVLAAGDGALLRARAAGSAVPAEAALTALLAVLRR
jgi:TetR/AcrR family transcriptional repressor of nem operon